MAQRYNGVKEKVAMAMAQNPNLTKADIEDLKKQYRKEYNRLLKLAGAKEGKITALATLNTKKEMLPVKSVLDSESRAKLMEGTFEEFFSRADTIHTQQALIDFIEDTFEDEQSDQDAAFEMAVNMANGAGEDYDFSSEPLSLSVTEAEFKIDMWWNNVISNPERGWERVLRPSLLGQLDRWVQATIKLIGPENFVDLMENKMGYENDASHGDDWETFFFQKYSETDEDCVSRISLWMQKATEVAMNYIPEDDDMGDYDEVTYNIIDELNELEILWSK